MYGFPLIGCGLTSGFRDVVQSVTFWQYRLFVVAGCWMMDQIFCWFSCSRMEMTDGWWIRDWCWLLRFLVESYLVAILSKKEVLVVHGLCNMNLVGKCGQWLLLSIVIEVLKSSRSLSVCMRTQVCVLNFYMVALENTFMHISNWVVCFLVGSACIVQTKHYEYCIFISRLVMDIDAFLMLDE